MGQELITPSTVLVLMILFAFGIAYNAFVGWLERNGRDRGFTALLVVVGTAITLAGFGIVAGWRPMILAFLCFAASGAPMTIGSIWRHIQQREQDEQEIIALVQQLIDDET